MTKIESDIEILKRPKERKKKAHNRAAVMGKLKSRPQDLFQIIQWSSSSTIGNQWITPLHSEYLTGFQQVPCFASGAQVLKHSSASQQQCDFAEWRVSRSSTACFDFGLSVTSTLNTGVCLSRYKCPSFWLLPYWPVSIGPPVLFML